jgi:hypothetical protein
MPHYERRVWNDPRSLERHVRKADILLVDGDTRVAQIIQYLTKSCWSHAALYIGDELVRRGGPAAEAAIAAYGEEGARHLMIEALPDGVVATPITKYVDYNIRLVRPHRLRPDHEKQILADAIGSLGLAYDVENILDLARYLIPVKVVPERLRRTALHFGSSEATEVICSSLLGRIFHRVRFPILPAIDHPEGFDAPSPSRRSGILRRIFGYESSTYTGFFRMRHPTLLTPRDFDLSPYFEIVKFNVIADGGFDYQKIQWSEVDDDPVPRGEERGLEAIEVAPGGEETTGSDPPDAD